MPAWSGLQSIVAVNIADAIADALLAFLAARRPLPRQTGPPLHLAGQFLRWVATQDDRRGLQDRLPPRNRGAETRQCPPLRRWPPHVGRSVSGKRKVSAGPLTDTALPVGRRILETVRATRDSSRRQHQSWHPSALRATGESGRSGKRRSSRRMSARYSASMTMDDAASVFEAIVLASPGGLGSAEAHDVRDAPAVPLIEAMRAASGRDLSRASMSPISRMFSTSGCRPTMLPWRPAKAICGRRS